MFLTACIICIIECCTISSSIFHLSFLNMLVCSHMFLHHIFIHKYFHHTYITYILSYLSHHENCHFLFLLRCTNQMQSGQAHHIYSFILQLAHHIYFLHTVIIQIYFIFHFFDICSFHSSKLCMYHLLVIYISDAHTKCNLIRHTIFSSYFTDI